jgi:hypothetical protein
MDVIGFGRGSAGRSFTGHDVQGNVVAAACWAVMPTAAKLARTPLYNSMAAGAPVWGVDSSRAAAAAVACLLCWQGIQQSFRYAVRLRSPRGCVLPWSGSAAQQR